MIGMIELVTIPFSGPPHHAQTYRGVRWNTRLGVGRVCRRLTTIRNPM